MRRQLYVAWSILKLLVGIALLPLLALLFFISKSAFLGAMTFLWVHLDIFTPQGELYLRRFFMTPKTQWYCPRFLHYIALSDEGRDPHDHPGAFTTTILAGGYNEEIYFPRVPVREGGFGRPGNPFIRQARPFETYVNPVGHTHDVKLIGPTMTWVKGWKRGISWGFWNLDPVDPKKDTWVYNEDYGEKGGERKSWTIDGQ